MSLKTSFLNDFSLGLNLMKAPDELTPGECSAGSTDFETDVTGSKLQSRRYIHGLDLSAALPVAGTSAPDGDRISVMRTYRLTPTASDRLIVSNANGLIATINPNAGPPATYTSVLAAAGGGDKEYEFLQALDSGTTEYVWCLNGVSAPQKYNVNTGALAAWAGTPPNGTMLRVWKNMMIISGVAAQPQRLYYSTIANPESWPANNFIDIKSTDDEDDPITAIEVIGENLLVFKRNSVWLVFDSVSFDNRRIGSPGCVYRSALCRIKDSVFYVSWDGVYSTDGDSIDYESANIERIWLGGGQNVVIPNNYTSPALTRLVDTWDQKVLLLNYRCLLDNSSKSFPVLCLDTRIKRPDGQHPWYSYGGSAGAAGATNGMGPIACVSAAVKGVFNQVSGSNAQMPSMMGILRDPAAALAGTAAQYLANLFRPGIQFTSGQEDLINAVSYPITGTFRAYINRIEGIENKIRIRRITLTTVKSYTSGTANERVSMQVDDDSGNSSGLSTVAIPTTSTPQFVSWRPERRGRWFFFTIKVLDGATITAVEIKYRGGTEH